MPPTLEWHPRVAGELKAIYDYIAADNPEAARKLRGEIRLMINQLPQHPRMYPRWRQTGTRKMVVRRNYIVIYAETPEVVTILHIKHAAMGYFN